MSETTTLQDHPFAVSAKEGGERRHSLRQAPAASPLTSMEWRQVLGGVFLLAGIVAVFVAWFGVSGTLDPGKQMPYLVSGGIGGASLIAVGMTLFLSLEHARDRAALEEVLGRLDAVEGRLDRIAPSGGEGQASANGRRASRSSSSRSAQ